MPTPFPGMDPYEGEKFVREPDVLTILPYAGQPNGGVHTRVGATLALAESATPYVVDLLKLVRRSR